jgi:hypothetical protein
MKRFRRFLAFFALALLVAQPSGSDLVAKSGLPPRYEVASEALARLLAGKQAVAVLGTGSMRPYIPASPNPQQIVAIAVTELAPYEELKNGELVVFRFKDSLVIHQIVAREGDRWISSGLANRHYDATRVSRETYERRVVRVYVIKRE